MISVEKVLWREHSNGKTSTSTTPRFRVYHNPPDGTNRYHTKINKVLRRLGGSYDWTREAFTMDPQTSEAVIEAFVRLHDDGLIYRSNRLVNWCVHLNTTVSNLEVDTIDLPGRTLLTIPGYDRKIEFGVLTSFAYPLVPINNNNTDVPINNNNTDAPINNNNNTDDTTTTTTPTTTTTAETITVSTTRLETMLGDVAIAVHPTDTRYTHLVGRFARHPFAPDGRLLPIIADPIADPSFGSGAVKITPAHDAKDFAVGVAHGLEFVNVLNDDGTMNANCGKRFEGMRRYDVRRELRGELGRLGLLVGEEENPMTIRLCAKSRDVIEPVMKPQWWMSMRELAGPAMEAVICGDVTIRPETASRSYFQWLENINDWCLSRQLWWGHQIPAYLVRFAAGGLEPEEEVWIVARSEAEAREKATKRFPGREFSLERDPDVLDTWFSSALWPFATLGWPHKTHDMQNLFPMSVLESGWDTLFFWSRTTRLRLPRFFVALTRR